MCVQVEDPVHQAYLGSSIRYLNKIIFDQKQGSKFEGNCPKCSKPAKTLVCPHCHNEIPFEMIDANIAVVSLIGVSGVGKTHYVTLLLKQALNNLNRYGISVRRLGEQTFKRLDENYDKYLTAENPSVIPRTVTAQANTEIRYPWIISLDRKRRSLFSQSFKSIYLVIYDAAGEDFLSADLIHTNVASISESDGWIFLLDPLQFPGLRNRLPPDQLPDAVSDQSAAIERAYNYVREATKAKIVKKPVAMTMTKIDVLEPNREDFGLPARIFRHRENTDPTKMHEKDITDGDGIIRSLVTKYMDGNFITQTDTYFKIGRFFGVSALGSSPQEGMIVNELMPLRLEDPILWLLTALKRWK